MDGGVVHELCNKIGIEKRRSSAYHSQGNGFAERNIRNVKETLRAVMLHRKLDQKKWRQLLPELVFALNCSESSAIKCIPYEVVFGRAPLLPLDLTFSTSRKDRFSEAITPREYSEEVQFSLNDMFEQVIDKLKLSKIKMQKQYNRNLNFFDYEKGEKVWLKVKHYKSGDNRKLSPRRTGLWTVVDKMPNGVNFRIRNNSKEEKVVHHDRIYPVRGNLATQPSSRLASVPLQQLPHLTTTAPTVSHPACSSGSLSSSSSDLGEQSDYEPSSEEGDLDLDYDPPSDADSSDSGDGNVPQESVATRYPQRVRHRRTIPGAVPWSEVDL